MNTKTISKLIKISKAVLYSASAAPFVMRILDAAGVEIDRDVKFYVDVMAPVAAGTAGLAYGALKGKARECAETMFLINHPDYHIIASCKEGHVVSVNAETLIAHPVDMANYVADEIRKPLASRKI